PFREGLPILERVKSSRSALKSDYSAFLGFLSTHHPERLAFAPEAHVDQALTVEYARHRLESYRGTTVKSMLDNMAIVLTAICPEKDWTWIGQIANQARPSGKPKQPRRHVTSDVLYAL